MKLSDRNNDFSAAWTSRWGLFAAIACVLTLVSTAGTTALAQEVQVTGPLAGAPAVRNMRIYREGRIQVQPFIGFTLQDEYSRTIFLGGQINYHFTDWLGIGVWGGYGIAHMDTSLTSQVQEKGQTTSGQDVGSGLTSEGNRFSFPSAKNFPNQIGKMQWAGALQATFIPLRGKLSLFQNIFIDTDFYLFGGVAAVGVEERADATNACLAQDQCLASQNARASRIAIAPTFGAGLTLYATKWMGVSLEWRGLPFSWNTSGTDESGGGRNNAFPDGKINAEDRVWHFNNMFNVGMAFYFPTKGKITP